MRNDRQVYFAGTPPFRGIELPRPVRRRAFWLAVFWRNLFGR